MPIVPKFPHSDLRVTHEIITPKHLNNLCAHEVHNTYEAKLLNPDGTPAALPLVFHKGSPEHGWHGWTTGKVIEALIKHMEYHQTTIFSCPENEEILAHLQAALRATEVRVELRKERGVLYDHTKP